VVLSNNCCVKEGFEMIFEDLKEMNPFDFEKIVCKIFENLGYKVKHIKQGDDIGIDILASNGNELLAVQVKKYVQRKINLEMIYHTYGAAAFYGCSKAIIITLNELTLRAYEASKKLPVEIWGKDIIKELAEKIDFTPTSKKEDKKIDSEDWFYKIWVNHIKCLQKKQLKHLVRNSHFTITCVDDDGICIVNSKGAQRNIDIYSFRDVITKLKNDGKITREAINDDYQRRGSSVISAILATLPNVHKDDNARETTLIWNTVE